MPRGKKERTSSIQKDPIYSTDDFRMYCFKVMPCSKHYSHDWTECPFAHPGEKATRRDPRLFTYVGIECPHAKNEPKDCPQGDQCPFAHNVFECWLHPSRYRTQMCNELETCKRKICFFAHKAEELRQPSGVSHDIDVNRPARSKPPSTKSSPPPEYRRPSCDGRYPRSQNIRGPGSRGASLDLPPRPRGPSIDGPGRAGRHQSPPVVANPMQSTTAQQLIAQSTLLEQLNALSAFNQQQQQTVNSLDLAGAFNGLSLNGNPSLIQSTGVPMTPGMENGGLQNQSNAVLLALLQQQLQNSNSGQIPTPQGPVNIPDQFQTDGPSPGSSSPSIGVPALTNPVLLQQLRQLQYNQGLGGLPRAGLRSSLDSSLSTGSTGTRIPTRVSYDGMSSSMTPNLPSLTELGSLPQGMSESLSSPDFILPRAYPRSSTESSYADSYGQWALDMNFLESLRQTDLLGLAKSEALSNEQLPVADFISLDDGKSTFVSTNACRVDPQTAAVSFSAPESRETTHQ